MRILHITNYLPYSHNTWGGAEMACKNIVDLLSIDKNISQAVAATLPQEKVTGPFVFFPIETVPDRYPASYFHVLRHYWLQKDPVVQSQIKAAVQVFRPDVVHFHNFNVLTFSALKAVKSAGIPAVLSIYDYWIFCPTNMLIDLDNTICEKGHGFHCIRRCLSRQFFKTSHYVCNLPIVTRRRYFSKHIAMFDRIIALSENSKNVLKKYGEGQPDVEVVRLAIDVDSGAPQGDLSDKPTALFAGWVQARKGPDILVKAMAQVVKKIPNAHLDIVGPLCESGFETYIRGLAKDLGVDKNIDFTGKLPRDEFKELFSKAAIIVVAEQWENMSPVFVLESMATGKAIVSGKIGGIPELIRDEKDGLLVQYDSPSDFAEKMTVLFSDSNMARALGQSAKKRVAELCDREVIMKKLIDIYKKIVTQKDARLWHD